MPASPDPRPARVFIGLGSNLGDRLATVRGVVECFEGGVIAGAAFVRVSPIYETRPVGPAKYRFLNAVAELHTHLEPHAILSELLALELRFGRVRTCKGAARTLDLDLLAYVTPMGSRQIDTPQLQCPHPRMPERDFVLAPFCDLAPQVRPWGRRTIAEMLVDLPESAATIVRQLTEQAHRPQLGTATCPTLHTAVDRRTAGG